jgi:hypothetical protein
MLANASVAPTVPRKIGLNWFIPAFANRRVASLCGTTEAEETARQVLADYLEQTTSRSINKAMIAYRNSNFKQFGPRYIKIRGCEPQILILYVHGGVCFPAARLSQKLRAARMTTKEP